MIKQLYYLTKVQTCNFFALNEAKYSKDLQKRKSIRAMFIAYLIVGAMLVFYSVGVSVMLAEVGLADVTPTYLGMLSM